MSVRAIRYVDKLDLAHRIVTDAPAGSTSFRLGKELGQNCRLIEYGKGGLGLEKLRRELGVNNPPQYKPPMTHHAQELLKDWRYGKMGVLLD